MHLYLGKVVIAKWLHLLDKIITCEKPLDDADLLELDNRQIQIMGISGKGRLQFCEDLEFLGILSYTLRGVEFLGISGNWIWGNLNTLKSK